MNRHPRNSIKRYCIAIKSNISYITLLKLRKCYLRKCYLHSLCLFRLKRNRWNFVPYMVYPEFIYTVILEQYLNIPVSLCRHTIWTSRKEYTAKLSEFLSSPLANLRTPPALPLWRGDQALISMRADNVLGKEEIPGEHSSGCRHFPKVIPELISKWWHTFLGKAEHKYFLHAWTAGSHHQPAAAHCDLFSLPTFHPRLWAL